MKDKIMKKGFTLIELLIVIAIIGILAVALLPSVTSAPARARDAQRQADLNVIITALELYNSDKGHYPSDTGTCVDQLGDGAAAPSGGILAQYMKAGTTPTDPSGVVANCYSYFYQGKANATNHNGTSVNYYLGAKMENLQNQNALAFPPASADTLKKGQTGGTYYVVEQ